MILLLFNNNNWWVLFNLIKIQIRLLLAMIILFFLLYITICRANVSVILPVEMEGRLVVSFEIKNQNVLL